MQSFQMIFLLPLHIQGEASSIHIFHNMFYNNQTISCIFYILHIILQHLHTLTFLEPKMSSALFVGLSVHHFVAPISQDWLITSFLIFYMNLGFNKHLKVSKLIFLRKIIVMSRMEERFHSGAKNQL